MNSFYYPLYQLAGWGLVYAGILFMVARQPIFSKTEFVFGAVLIGAAALWSHVLRWGFKRWIKHTSFLGQLGYLFVGAIVGGLVAGAVLLASIALLQGSQWLDPVPDGQWSTLVSIVYWPNSINMMVALVVWGALYLTFVRSRLLRDAELALSQGQLELLMQQLNPHFLFNMLNNIRALILENPNKARDALTQLADMLRYSLQAHKQARVELGDELDIVEQYIALNKVQYEHRLQYSQEIDVEAYHAMIPRLLLQQSIENAIKHGIATLPDGGRIHLSVRRKGDNLQIALTNPIASNQPPQRSDTTLKRRRTKNTGIGLANSRSRLNLIYGRAATLTFNCDEQLAVATLVITLPFEATAAESEACA